MTLPGLVSALREAHWLNRRRVAAWGIVLLAEEILLVFVIGLWLHSPLVEAEHPTSTDFVSFYAAGKLALAGTPALAYDQTAHHAAEQQATAPGVPYMLFIYPPVFLPLCAGLATLPYLVAFVLFQLVTLAAFAWVMRGVLGETGWAWLPPVLAFPAVFWTVGLGQNAFLTAALLGGFTLLIDRRPVTAGILLGMVCYKPHFGLLAPVALLAGRHWRAFGAATIMIAVLVGTSIGLFGWKTWEAWLATFAASPAIYASGRIAFGGMVTPFGGARLLGFDPGHAYAIQAMATATMVAVVAWVWGRRMSRPSRGATLLVATLLAVPLALFYDMLLGLVAIGWLIREARVHGFLPWEKILLLAIYAAALATWTVGTAWHVPLGPAITLTILLLCLRRVVASARAAGNARPARRMDAGSAPFLASRVTDSRASS